MSDLRGRAAVVPMSTKRRVGALADNEDNERSERRNLHYVLDRSTSNIVILVLHRASVAVATQKRDRRATSQRTPSRARTNILAVQEVSP